VTPLSPRHPRFTSLRVRATLADAARAGVVVPEGLIAQGRAEAFDYLLGERTSPPARRAIRTAAVWLVRAERPVLSVNGNVAALASKEVARLAETLPSLGVEVNLFHRTPARATAIARILRRAGVREVLGVRPTWRLPGLESDRALADRRGIAVADVCLVPLEDGDRTEALRRAGKRVIAIDLNPLSRTARTADLPIIDELTRALAGLAHAVPAARRVRGVGFPPAGADDLLSEAVRAIARRLNRLAVRPRRLRSTSPRPARGGARRSRRARRAPPRSRR